MDMFFEFSGIIRNVSLHKNYVGVCYFSVTVIISKIYLNI